MSSYQEALAIQLGINVLLGWSAWLPLATGQLSIGNAGFMAIGAYTASVLTVRAGLPLVPALIAGALLAALAGVLVGIPALRLHGIYLAMATLGFGEIVRTFFLNFEPTGGAMGFRGMTGVSLGAVWGWVLLAAVALWALAHSRVGLALDAVHDDEIAAELAGLDVTRLKVGAFGAGAALAGIAGGLYAQHLLYIEPASFNFLESIAMVLFVLLGGLRTFWGVVVGATLFTVLPEMTRFLRDWRGAFFGGVLVALLIWRPWGLLPRGALRWNRRLAAPAGS